MIVKHCMLAHPSSPYLAVSEILCAMAGIKINVVIYYYQLNVLIAHYGIILLQLEQLFVRNAILRVSTHEEFEASDSSTITHT